MFLGAILRVQKGLSLGAGACYNPAPIACKINALVSLQAYAGSDVPVVLYSFSQSM